MKKYINTAANLSLSAFNRELSNSVFQKKRDLPEKGYKFSPLRMDKFLCNFDYWNIETLRLRKEWMIDRFKTIWKYPELEFEERQNEDNREVDILDIDSIEVTSKKIDYFIFFDTKYEKASYQSLFQTVVKIMFEREPNIFFGADLVEYLKLTQNPNELRNSLKISQVYYIERNLSAAAIVKRIQTILIKCETDDILLIKLKDE